MYLSSRGSSAFCPTMLSGRYVFFMYYVFVCLRGTGNHVAPF